MSFQIFTLNEGVTEGVETSTFTLNQTPAVSFPAVIIGEEGRGRSLGVLPVSGDIPQKPCPNREDYYYATQTEYQEPTREPSTCAKCGQKYSAWQKVEYDDYDTPRNKWVSTHPQRGTVNDRLRFADIGETKSGRPKLITAEKATDNTQIICVSRTGIGFAGANSYTGDFELATYSLDYFAREKVSIATGNNAIPPKIAHLDLTRYGAKFSKDERELIQVELGLREDNFEVHNSFLPFPGTVIVEGTIAQGLAGRMGSGTQMVFTLPKGKVCRISRSGRLYGAPGAYYYKWTGKKLLCATMKERELSDLF